MSKKYSSFLSVFLCLLMIFSIFGMMPGDLLAAEEAVCVDEVIVNTTMLAEDENVCGFESQYYYYISTLDLRHDSSTGEQIDYSIESQFRFEGNKTYYQKFRVDLYRPAVDSFSENVVIIFNGVRLTGPYIEADSRHIIFDYTYTTPSVFNRPLRINSDIPAEGLTLSDNVTVAYLDNSYNPVDLDVVSVEWTYYDPSECVYKSYVPGTICELGKSFKLHFRVKAPEGMVFANGYYLDFTFNGEAKKSSKVEVSRPQFDAEHSYADFYVTLRTGFKYSPAEALVGTIYEGAYDIYWNADSYAHNDGYIMYDDLEERRNTFYGDMNIVDARALNKFTGVYDLSLSGCALKNDIVLTEEDYPSLERLTLGNSQSELDSLKCKIDLSRLYYIDAGYGKLSELDVTGCDMLGNVICNANLFDSVDLGEKEWLNILDCSGNIGDLKYVDISGCPYLLDCYNNGTHTQEEAECADGTTKTCDLYKINDENYLKIDSDVKIVTGKVKVEVSVDPADAGTVTGSGEYSYGEDVKVTCKAGNGYELSYWQLGEEKITDDVLMFNTADQASPVTVVAHLEKKAIPTPTVTQAPTATPTSTPTVTPTTAPTTAPTTTPTVEPTVKPTVEPTLAPPITATDVPTPTSAPQEGRADEKIREFVDRIYKYVLDREPEAEGAAFWIDELWNFRRTGAEVAQGFIFSPEFENRNTSDKDFITILYRTFFGRDPEDAGLNFWLGQLSSGAMDRVAVANGFIYSQEWADTCAVYGIRSGGNIKTVFDIAPTDLTYAFVDRLYSTALGREPDKAGRDYWAKELSNFDTTGEQAGASFFLCDEMNDFCLSDEEFLLRLYATFMDREPDSDGKTYWLEVLSSGFSRADVVFGFTRSPEFTEKCVEARILPY